HLAGQHLDVRLTAEDGYQAQRSYSVASAPEDSRVAITVERLEDGEVSPYLVGEVREGDRIEVRGPIGGFFVWQAGDPRPLVLVAGGSGIVPLMAMLRHRKNAGATTAARLLYSSRGLSDVIYREELDHLAARGDGLGVTLTLTRTQPPGWSGHARRIDRSMIEEIAWPRATRPSVFICGPTAMVESAAGLLLEVGYDADWIKTERFGATGG
ncbi:MAG TPA: ferredoxin reductase, partial [Candidatus Sulfotelmatobacter sp.]|nr:ferredoxin reductase [Candidatus Sulfotelmatobacter sp.]